MDIQHKAVEMNPLLLFSFNIWIKHVHHHSFTCTCKKISIISWEIYVYLYKWVLFLSVSYPHLRRYSILLGLSVWWKTERQAYRPNIHIQIMGHSQLCYCCLNSNSSNLKSNLASFSGSSIIQTESRMMGKSLTRFTLLIGGSLDTVSNVFRGDFHTI